MLLLLYFTFVTLVYILALPLLLFLSFKKKYKSSIPARFFLYKNPPFKKKDAIWFHACSLGEVNALKVIINQIKDVHVNFSVITQTGFKSAKTIENIGLRYLPFEVFLPFWIRKQKVLVVLEAELWPMLFVISKLRGTKTILLNARISDNSYNSYKKFAFFYRWIFSYVDKVFAQSELDKQRLLELGAKNVVVNGNIKTLSIPTVSKKYKKPSSQVLTLASTHEGEEELLLENLLLPQACTLIVVPRHPERFESVEQLLRKYAKTKGKSYSRLSENELLNTDIVLCDKMGELVNIYAITDITYLGGSFKEGIGGHNPLEPAFFNNKIISGEYFFNQFPLYKLVKNIKVCLREELKSLNYDLVEKSEVLYQGEMDSLLQELKENVE